MSLIRCAKEKAENYLWNKEWELLCNQIKLTINTVTAVKETVQTYNSVVKEKVNVSDRGRSITILSAIMSLRKWINQMN